MSKLFDYFTPLTFIIKQRLPFIIVILFLTSVTNGCGGEDKKSKSEVLTDEQIQAREKKELLVTTTEAIEGALFFYYDASDEEKFKFTALEEYKTKKGGAEGEIKALIEIYDNTHRYLSVNQIDLSIGTDFVQASPYGEYEISGFENIIKKTDNPQTLSPEIDSGIKVVTINGFDYSAKYSDGTSRRYVLPTIRGANGIVSISSARDQSADIAAGTKYKGDIFMQLAVMNSQNAATVRQTVLENVVMELSQLSNEIRLTTAKLDLGADYDTSTVKKFDHIKFSNLKLGTTGAIAAGEFEYFLQSSPVSMTTTILNINPKKFFGPSQAEFGAYLATYLVPRQGTSEDLMRISIGAKKCTAKVTGC